MKKPPREKQSEQARDSHSKSDTAFGRRFVDFGFGVDDFVVSDDGGGDDDELLVGHV